MIQVGSPFLSFGFSSDSLQHAFRTAQDFDELQNSLAQQAAKVLILRPEPGMAARIKALEPLLPRSSQVILLTDQLNTLEIKELVNSIAVFKIVTHPPSVDFNVLVAEAIDEHELVFQNQNLVQMLETQSIELENLKIRLDRLSQERIQIQEQTKHQRQRAVESLSHLLRALEGIHQALSVDEIRRAVLETLPPQLGVKDLQIRPGLPLEPEAGSDSQVHFTLSHEGHSLGHITFDLDGGRRKNPDLLEALKHIVEVVNLNIIRLKALLETIGIQKEWELTFDSLNIPTALVTENFDIIRSNEAFSKEASTHSSSLQNKKCHELLFGSQRPCQGCQLGSRFQIREDQHGRGSHTFEVSSSLFSQQLTSRVYVNFYRDLTPLMKAERTILENVKTSEVGLITSSIAHELTNPVAGMLTFLQLLKSEIAKTDSRYPFIEEMWKAASRCQQLIEELLAYSRRQESSSTDASDLSEILTRAESILSLQTRSLGMEFKSKSRVPAKVRGHRGALVQAFVGLFQAAVGSLLQSGFNPGRSDNSIYVDSAFSGRDVEIQLRCSYGGADFPGRPELAFTRRIIEEHGGQIEISSETSIGLSAKVRIPTSEP